MKIVRRSLFLASLAVVANTAFAHDVLLFDSSESAVAILDTDNQNTIYLESGQPIGYVFEGGVYTFTGKFMGSYSNGVLWDKKGYMIAFIQTSAPYGTHIKPIANPRIVQHKQKRPAIVTIREIPVPHPKYTYQIAPTTLAVFFEAAPQAVASIQSNNAPITNTNQTNPLDKSILIDKQIKPSAASLKYDKAAQLEKDLQASKPKFSFWQKALSFFTPDPPKPQAKINITKDEQLTPKPLATPVAKLNSPTIQTPIAKTKAEPAPQMTAEPMVTASQEKSNIQPKVKVTSNEPIKIEKSGAIPQVKIELTQSKIELAKIVPIIQPNESVIPSKIEAVKSIEPNQPKVEVMVKAKEQAISTNVEQSKINTNTQSKIEVATQAKVEPVTQPKSELLVQSNAKAGNDVSGTIIISTVKIQPPAQTTTDALQITPAPQSSITQTKIEATTPTKSETANQPFKAEAIAQAPLEKSNEKTTKALMTPKNTQSTIIPLEQPIQVPKPSLFERIAKTIFPEKSKINEKTFKNYTLKLTPSEKIESKTTVITTVPTLVQISPLEKPVEKATTLSQPKVGLKIESIEKNNAIPLPQAAQLSPSEKANQSTVTPIPSSPVNPSITQEKSTSTVAVKKQMKEIVLDKSGSITTSIVPTHPTVLEKSSSITPPPVVQHNPSPAFEAKIGMFERALKALLPNKKSHADAVANVTTDLKAIQPSRTSIPKLKSSNLEKAMGAVLLEKTTLTRDQGNKDGENSFKK